MNQQVDVLVKLTLEVNAEKSKIEVAQDIAAGFRTLLISPNSPAHAILEKYKGGDTLSGLACAEVINVKEEAEIYGTEGSNLKDQLLSDIHYLFSKINWGASNLDARAITILNELNFKIRAL